MANVHTARFYDRSQLPHTINTDPAYLNSPVRRTKPNFPSHNVGKKDVNETLQQAALINIVAVVNEDIHSDTVRKPEASVPRSAIDSLKNTVAVLSNLITPHHRSVSIPKPQHMVFNMSNDIVQKKPVYYRHSEDDGRVYTMQEKTMDYSRGCAQTKTNSDAGTMCPSPVQKVKIMPVKSTYNDADFKIIEANLKKTEIKTTKHSECSQHVKSSSPSVRKLGTLKKTKARKLHEVSKCEAVDLMDTNNSLFDNKHGEDSDPVKAIIDDSRKIIPQIQMDSYIRPKSLPGAFPAKVKTLNRVKSSPPGKQHIYKSKNPIARSISKDTPQSMYGRMMSLPGGFGFESLAIGNGVNQEPDVFSPISHDSTRTPNPRISFTGLAMQRHSRRLGTPRTPATNREGRESTWSFGSTFYDHQTDLTPEPMSRLYEAIESAMGRASTHEEKDLEDKENELSGTPAKYRTQYTPAPSRRSPRKVQFESREITMSSNESGLNDCAKPIVNGGSSIIQMPVSVFRSYSPAIKPMSAHELLRFKQKIFPANMQQPTSPYPPFFATSSIMNIKQFRQKNVQNAPAKHDIIDIESVNFERDAESDANLEDFMADGVGAGNVQRVPKTTTVDEKLYPATGEDSCPEDPEQKQDFYKLIKAVDTHDYSGFEHKKLRKHHSDFTPKKGGDKQKEHYVKVKVV